MKPKDNSELFYFKIHQLKSPLSSLKWSLKMLLDGNFGKISKEQKELIGKMYVKNDEIISELNNILKDDKNGNNPDILDKHPIDIEEITQSAVNNCLEEIQSKKIKIIFDRQKISLPPITADKEKISSVIQNLVDNAVKYTKKNGEIEITLKEKNKEVEFKIKDSGIGIPENEQNNIFNKFFRSSNGGENANGAGIGLYMSKKYIESHGGKIWFESPASPAKQGASFYFTLPINN